jgi:hypothetical protein
MRNRVLLIAATILPLAAGCASTAGSSQNRDVITAEQIARTQAENAHAAIERLQPQWLTSRGPVSITDNTPTEASVFMDGINVGGVEYLKTVNVIDIAELRYYPAGTAGARFGMGFQRGVIEIIRKGR